MKRSQFLTLSAVIAAIFGLTMMFMPEKMLGNLMAVDTDDTVAMVMRWVGVGIFTLGCINFLSRSDAGSVALRAVLIGNIIMHVVGLIFDVYAYAEGYMQVSGLVMGIVVHLLLTIGFWYFLSRAPKQIVVT